MSPRSVFITGCNRGIGLELVKQYIKASDAPTHLFATYRSADAASELLSLSAAHDNVHAVQMDVTEHEQFDDVVQQVGRVVGEEGLNLLVNNAGVLPSNRTLATVTAADMRAAFEVNCLAPMFLTKAFLPLLQLAADKTTGGPALSVRRAAAVQMSTAVASISENSGGGSYAYRTSKTALNMVMKNLSIDLRDRGVLVMAMHPGWVMTDMGGPGALIDAETCASDMIATLEQLGDKDHGTFLRYNNTPVAW